MRNPGWGGEGGSLESKGLCSDVCLVGGARLGHLVVCLRDLQLRYAQEKFLEQSGAA